MNYVAMAIFLLAGQVVTAGHAQVRLPALPLPAISPPALPGGLGTDLSARLTAVRQLSVDRLIRSNRQLIDTDSHGDPIVRGEILASAPNAAALERALEAGFEVDREQAIEFLDIRLVVLRAPVGMSTTMALRTLRASDPQGVYDYNHIYTGSGTASAAAAPSSAAVPSSAAAPSTVADAARPHSPVRIGLIDSGVDASHIAFRNASIQRWGCGGEERPDPHGTAVASLMVGLAPAFSGVQPSAQLFAADAFCGRPTGGAVDALVAALGWLVEMRVPVINVSLVGPTNGLLQAAVAAVTQRGYLIVAAVGNDGPAAAPLFPASYPRVIGVTAVDSHDHVLIEAARGPQVMFAAPGADLMAAAANNGFAPVRGTSFTAPIVTSFLAQELQQPDPAQAAAAVDALAKTAHPTSRARDLTYGFGVVGADYRGRNRPSAAYP